MTTDALHFPARPKVVSLVPKHPGPAGASKASAQPLQVTADTLRVLPMTAVPRDVRGANALAFGSTPDTLGELWDALSSGRVVVHYQPQINLQSGATVAMEALVRFLDAQGRLRYPSEFIDLVEDTSLIVGLGRAVTAQVCRDLARWRRGAPGGPERVAINVSPVQLSRDPRYVDFVAEELCRYGLSFESLEFEITERQLLATGSNAVDTVRALSSQGARISLDDFGTGYSSLSYLATLPVDALKLERSMTSKLPGDPVAARIIGQIVALASALELEVVAEGIETEAQSLALRKLGCTLGQGFVYGAPASLG